MATKSGKPPVYTHPAAGTARVERALGIMDVAYTLQEHDRATFYLNDRSGTVTLNFNSRGELELHGSGPLTLSLNHSNDMTIRLSD